MHIMCLDPLHSPTLPYPSFLYPLCPQSPRLLSPPPPDSIHERKCVVLAFMSSLFHLTGCSPAHPPFRKWPKFVLYGWAKLHGIWCAPRLSIHPLTGIKAEVTLGCFTSAVMNTGVPASYNKLFDCLGFIHRSGVAELYHNSIFF